jgi:HEAT repeat protein
VWRRGKEKEGIQDSLRVLQDERAVVRWQAVEDLGWQASRLDASALEALAGALSDGHPFVRWQAGRSLVKAGRERALPLLLRELNGQSPEGRAAAADALGNLPGMHAVTALVAALSDGDEGVRCSAVEALARIGRVEAGPTLEQVLLHDDSPLVRRGAAWALGRLRDPASAPALQRALQDGSPLVRRSAAYALSYLRSQGAVSALIDALGDDDPQVRWNAACALGEIRAQEALPALQQATEDEALALHGPVAIAARQAIARVKRISWRERLGLSKPHPA